MSGLTRRFAKGGSISEMVDRFEVAFGEGKAMPLAVSVSQPLGVSTTQLFTVGQAEICGMGPELAAALKEIKAAREAHGDKTPLTVTLVPDGENRAPEVHFNGTRKEAMAFPGNRMRVLRVHAAS